MEWGLRWWRCLLGRCLNPVIANGRNGLRTDLPARAPITATAHAPRKGSIDMERVLMLQLDAVGCAAQAVLNGLPVASVGVAGGRVCLAVNEYTLTGRNELSVVVGPAPAGSDTTPMPRVSIGTTSVTARLVLARMGQSPADANVRVLAEVAWSVDDSKSYDTPATHAKEVELPVNFPRWRWLDAPAVSIGPGVQRQVLEFVQQRSVELGRGHPDALIAACKLRFDELALAYQTDSAVLVQRFRAHVQRLYADKALKLVPPLPQELLLRPLLDGRLIECLSVQGGPALCTRNEEPGSPNHAWPLRLAMVEGRIYVLR